LKVVVIEDDPQIVENIKAIFQMGWPEARLTSARQGEEGVNKVIDTSPNLVILDLGLPDIGGIEVLKRIRKHSNVPVMILTIRSEENDVVRGLAAGADDYVLKPFRQFELLARARAITRRTYISEEDLAISYGGLRFGEAINEIYYGDSKISITPTEGRIIHCLMENGGKVVSYKKLANRVWGEDYPGIQDSLKVHVKHLRKKLENNLINPKLITNKPGIGYCLGIPE
jgi:two-component system KDP operon response regulator KdpE